MNKRILISALLWAVTMCVFAQDHLKFKGVPIDGTREVFVAKMKMAGFREIGTEDGMTLLKGEFAGYKDCTLGVSTLKMKNLVSRIAVLFECNDTWSSLYGIYSDLTEMLTEKYGSPTKQVEKFNTYYTPTDDGDRMSQVNLGRCEYYTTYELGNGRIQVSIEHMSYNGNYVLLKYEDKINADDNRKAAMDDL